MKIKNIYPVVDTIGPDGNRITVDVVLVWDGKILMPKMSKDRGKTVRHYLHFALPEDHAHIRALGFLIGDEVRDMPPLELAEVVPE